MATEEKPFIELDQLKQLPNNVAIVLPSNGDRMLPATATFLRPLWIQKKYPHLPVSTPWLDWPAELRTTYDLDSVPQELNWSGWGTSEPIAESAVIPMEGRLGKFIQAADVEQVVTGPSHLPSLFQPEPSILPPPLSFATPRPQDLQPLSASPHQPIQPDLAPPEDPSEAENPDDPRAGDPFAGLPDDI